MAQPPSYPLEKAQELLHAGKKSEARGVLIDYLKTYPDAAEGWWLMSYATDDAGEQFECLEEVLRLHPNHRKAQERLDALMAETRARPVGFDLRERFTSIPVPGLISLAAAAGLGLLLLGFLGYRLFTPQQILLPTSAALAPANATVTLRTDAAQPNTSPTPLPVGQLTLRPAVTHTPTPLISNTPTRDPNATPTAIPENKIGTSPGQYPPDFTLIDSITNAEVNLRAKIGKPIVLIFFNTLETESEPQMPGLQAIYEKYQDEGLVVLGVGVGSSQSALRNYTGRFGGLTFPLLSDWEHTVASDYEVKIMPTTFFIRKNGKIWQVNAVALTEDELDAVVTSLLKMP